MVMAADGDGRKCLCFVLLLNILMSLFLAVKVYV